MIHKRKRNPATAVDVKATVGLRWHKTAVNHYTLDVGDTEYVVQQDWRGWVLSGTATDGEYVHRVVVYNGKTEYRLKLRSVGAVLKEASEILLLSHLFGG